MDLKQNLSMLLNEELAKRLVQGETVVVSLPGSFGEALVVTDRRALVLRDHDSGTRCDVYGYVLSSVLGAKTNASGTGGYIELDLSETVANPDEVRIYFPSYEQAKFEEAAGYISDLASASSAVISSDATDTQHKADGKCPKCGAENEKGAAFCGQCGEQFGPICANCGSSEAAGSRFCSSCGSKFEELANICSQCGNRVQRWHSYCPECGSVTHTNCAQCGAAVYASWKYCPNCGRQFDSAYINPRSTVVRQIQSRMSDIESRLEQSEISIVTEPAASVEPTGTPQDRAAKHNQKGRELFESGDLEEAISEFKNAIILDPENASYHCNLAIAYDENEQDAEALAEYLKAIALDPNDLQALLSLGYMYSEDDETEKANEVWNRILEIAPASAEAQEVKENMRHQEEL